jgi:hypothetical protein
MLRGGLFFLLRQQKQVPWEESLFSRKLNCPPGSCCCQQDYQIEEVSFLLNVYLCCASVRSQGKGGGSVKRSGLNIGKGRKKVHRKKALTGYLATLLAMSSTVVPDVYKQLSCFRQKLTVHFRKLIQTSRS